MIKKSQGCDGCPLQTKGIGYCPDKHAPKVKYMIIGETPDKTEINKGVPFGGRAGFVLDNWLIRAVPELRLAKEKGEVSYMNTLRCLPPEVQGRAYPKGEDKELAEAHCRTYDNIPATVHTVVLLGEAPQRLWFGTELNDEDASDRRLGRSVKGVMGRIGREYIKDDKRWVFGPNPASILRQPALVQHGQMSLKIAANVDKAVEPDYIKWDVALQELGNV